MAEDVADARGGSGVREIFGALAAVLAFVMLLATVGHSFDLFYNDDLIAGVRAIYSFLVFWWACWVAETTRRRA